MDLLGLDGMLPGKLKFDGVWCVMNVQIVWGVHGMCLYVCVHCVCVFFG